MRSPLRTMVSTRNHPREFPEPDLSPSKPGSTSPRSLRSNGRKSQGIGQWAHTPSNAALIWLAISLPLVIWDTGYVLLRPHSMPGGKYHWPLWTPYELYGKVDYIYGWPAFEARNGFTSAQGTMNTIETLMYFVYLGIVWKYGTQTAAKGRGAPAPSKVGFLGRQRAVDGLMGAIAPLVLYSASIMTLSKTVLYCEYSIFYRHVYNERSEHQS